MELQKAKFSEIMQIANSLREKFTDSVYTNYYNQFDTAGTELFDLYSVEKLLCFGMFAGRYY